MQKTLILRKGRTTLAIAAALVAFGSTASALILTEKTEEQKLRADIQKQQHKYVACLVKASVNCEKSGDDVASECNLTNGTAMPPADAKGKFAADIAKCDAKLDFLKKAKTLTASTGYVAIGCPGDSNSGTAGDQPFTDISAWQAATPASTKSQINGLAVFLGVFSDCGSQPDTKSQQKCQAAETKRLSGYAFAIQKCQLACDNDYKAKKGDGGPTDAGNCNVNAAGTGGGGNPLFNVCVDKAFAKATSKTPFPPMVQSTILPALSTALNEANNDLNNENDCP